MRPSDKLAELELRLSKPKNLEINELFLKRRQKEMDARKLKAVEIEK